MYTTLPVTLRERSATNKMCTLTRPQLFSALYSMLPSAKSSLIKGGHSSQEASWILIACFAAGVIGIQIVSRVMHHFVPHNVVDCEHQHDDEENQKENGGHSHHGHADSHNHDHHDNVNHVPARHKSARAIKSHRGYARRPQMREAQTSLSYFSNHKSSLSNPTAAPSSESTRPSLLADEAGRRPTLQSRITSSVTKLASVRGPSCERDGPCHGYSDPCQETCFKSVAAAGGLKAPKATLGMHRPAATKSVTATEATPLLRGRSQEHLTRPHTRADAEGAAGCNHHQHDAHNDGPSDTSAETLALDGTDDVHQMHAHIAKSGGGGVEEEEEEEDVDDGQAEHHHHHHVPTNAFMEIGLQTSIAIALHKLPEGFITYATNHANPELGISVFIALFIHNITEGFAMALPLYLAINNRLQAMVISFVLGGLSQPLGAGVAAVWFHVAGQSNWAPSESGYGAMFAITAGIMTSVGLQLFAESLELTHSKHLCFIGAFAGMCILGASSALTA